MRIRLFTCFVCTLKPWFANFSLDFEAEWFPLSFINGVWSAQFPTMHDSKILGFWLLFPLDFFLVQSDFKSSDNYCRILSLNVIAFKLNKNFTCFNRAFFHVDYINLFSKVNILTYAIRPDHITSGSSCCYRYENPIGSHANWVGGNPYFFFTVTTAVIQCMSAKFSGLVITTGQLNSMQ